MTLGASLQIGRSGLLSSQAAMEVVGNNLANMATRGYHRQEVSLTPAGSQQVQQGVHLGRGVQVDAVTRQINEALEGRLRSALADESGSMVHQDMLAQIEAIENEFSDTDLSSRLSAFFDRWSNLAGNPTDPSLRDLVTDEAQALASDLQTMRSQFVQLRGQVDTSAGGAADQVNNLLKQVEDLNHRIATQAHGAGGASSLRDQRDAALGELAKYLDISTIEGESGMTDVFVGSLPIVLSGDSRGVELRDRVVDGRRVTDLVVAADGSRLDVSSGELGAMLSFRRDDLGGAMDTLDSFAHQLIWQVNRVHSQSQPGELPSEITGAVRVDDPSASLGSEEAGLAFAAQHGSFQLHVTQMSTGQRTTRAIDVDLDGIDPASDTSLASLAAQIDSTPNVSANITADGRLDISGASEDFRISFSDDTSGVLAALGVNTFFQGDSAVNVAVADTVAQNPQLVAAGQGHQGGDNRGALAIAALREKPVDELNGFSLSGYWSRHVEEYASRLARSREQVEADGAVRQNLESQQQSVSGVNADEETIDLMRHQRAYQASARFLSVVDEMMQTLLAAM